jgi:hypothetical protein
MSSQRMKDHSWTNRVLLILSSDPDATVVKSQIKELHENPEGIEDRKLIIYYITNNDTVSSSLPGGKIWTVDQEVYNRHSNSLNGFYVVWVGLDGTVKLKQSTVLKTKSLFSIIDAMPMRKNELKNKN